MDQSGYHSSLSPGRRALARLGFFAQISSMARSDNPFACNRPRRARAGWARSLTAAVLLLTSVPLTMTPVISEAQNLPTLGDTEREALAPLTERKLGEQI